MFWALHQGLRRVSGGRLGTSRPHDGRLGTLFLHTVGSKSGQARVNALYYLEDAPNLVVVASNAGDEADPAWWRNLLARPDAEVEVAGSRRAVRARQATPEEAARLWPHLDGGHPEYVAYRVKTSRPIPVVILEPG